MAQDYEVRLRVTSDIVITVEANSTHHAMLKAWMEALQTLHREPVKSKLIPLDAVQVIRRGKRKRAPG
jgi:hypothetical protein